MCEIHLIDNTAKVGNEMGRIYIRGKDGEKSIPIETVEGINVYGKPQLTTQCVEECLKRGIPISFFSSNGGYIGGFSAVNYINVKRQRLQAVFNQTDESFELAKKIIEAKVSNQIAILRRYNRTNNNAAQSNIDCMRRYRNHIGRCNDIHQLMGYEGISAREYFGGLGKIVRPEFYFSHRTKNPPQDHFNALLSFGYSLLYKELYGMVESKGLNPFFGFIHEDKEGHPALVSDLIEEWRTIIIDSMVMSLVNGNEISIDEDFEAADSEHPFYLTFSGRMKVIAKYNQKMETTTTYMDGYSSLSYRRAIDSQIRSLIYVIEDGNVDRYSPIKVR